MSVRAYIIEKITRKGNDGFTYYRNNEEYCFNLWKDNMFDYLLDCGAEDYTNIDCCGKIYVTEEVLINLNRKCISKRIKLTDSEKESFDLMKKYMKKSNGYIVLDCY